MWVICWTNEQDTGFHDHDRSAEGVVEAGGAFSFSAADIHRVPHVPETAAVTIHAYSPPLRRMGAYEVRDDGSLRRHAMSYAEELRPLENPTPA